MKKGTSVFTFLRKMFLKNVFLNFKYVDSELWEKVTKKIFPCHVMLLFLHNFGIRHSVIVLVYGIDLMVLNLFVTHLSVVCLLHLVELREFACTIVN